MFICWRKKRKVKPLVIFFFALLHISQWVLFVHVAKGNVSFFQIVCWRHKYTFCSVGSIKPKYAIDAKNIHVDNKNIHNNRNNNDIQVFYVCSSDFFSSLYVELTLLNVWIPSCIGFNPPPIRTHMNKPKIM